MAETLARIQPVPRVGDWLCTASGVRFFPCDPRPEDIFIDDIAHALAIENRFGGHLREPYSVAQHCVPPLAVGFIPWFQAESEFLARFNVLFGEGA